MTKLRLLAASIAAAYFLAIVAPLIAIASSAAPPDTAPGGSTGAIQFNSGSAFNGTSNLTADSSGDLTVGGFLNLTGNVLDMGSVGVMSRNGGTGAVTASLASGGLINFSSDTSISRTAAGIVGIGTGTQGSVAGGLQAASLAIDGASLGGATLAVTGNAQFNNTLIASTVTSLPGTLLTVEANGNGQSLLLASPNTNSASTAAGNVNITAGNATGTGASSNGGSIAMTTGSSTNGTAGNITINGTPAVTCSGTPSSSFAATKGIVTHC